MAYVGPTVYVYWLTARHTGIRGNVSARGKKV